jgi:hypothetical protein
VLLVAAAVAPLWANSPWQDAYPDVWDADTAHWINDGLMVVFFFVVGLTMAPMSSTIASASRNSLTERRQPRACERDDPDRERDVGCHRDSLVALRHSMATRLPVFLLFGFAVWLATYHSGIHATIAGVALGFVAPTVLADPLERRLHPWSSFGVVPVFALANAGVTFGTDAFDAPGAARVIAGIVVALVAGKAIGISVSTWLAGLGDRGSDRIDRTHRRKSGRAASMIHAMASSRSRLVGDPAMSRSTSSTAASSTYS